MLNPADILANAFTQHRAGNFQQAEELYGQLLAHDPQNVDAWHLKGVAALNLGRHQAAIEYILKAIDLVPTQAIFHRNLGLVYQTTGQLVEALVHYDEAVRLDPAYTVALHDRGIVLRRLGRLQEAGSVFRDVIARWPEYPGTYISSGNMLLAADDLDGAEASYRKCLGLQPDSVEAYLNLAGVLRSRGDLLQARACYREALRLKPGDPNGLLGYSTMLQEEGDHENAAAALDQVLKKAPTDALRLKAAFVLPIIHASTADLESRRSRFEREINELASSKLLIPDPLNEVKLTSFDLAYHGKNDREIQAAIANLYLSAAPALRHSSPHCADPARRSRGDGRARIGFLSRFLYNHTIGRLNAGLIRRLSRQDFQVFVFCVSGKDDGLSRAVREDATVVDLPLALDPARARIGAARLDVLYYPEIGMDPFTYYLAFSRLAPVQCVTWGHPVTTGIPTVDYFISAAGVEAPGADAHYTEKLVRLPELAIMFERPVPGSPFPGRAHFGLSEDDHLYGCLQSLFKLHPDFDAVIAGILRRDPRARVVLLDGKFERWKAILVQRFLRVMPDVSDRIVFFPARKHGSFLHLTMACDVLLDPFPFGGGTTTLEALALGMPVVTCPGEFLRGRLSLGLYRKMGYTECVAENPEEYVQLAVHLGTDSGYRTAVRERILATAPVLFEDPEAVRGLEDFFRSVLRGG